MKYVLIGDAIYHFWSILWKSESECLSKICRPSPARLST